MRTHLAVLVLMSCSWTQRALPAAESAPALSELGIDQVTLKHGPRLLGAVFDRTKEGTVTVAVSRGWLKKTHPKSYATYAAEGANERRAALEQLRERIAEWSERRSDDTKLAFFLKKQGERVERALIEKSDEASGADADFLFVSLPFSKIERVFVQPAERKQIAVVAWREGLADVESRSVKNLEKELQKRGIDSARERVDLSDRLPVKKQSDAEWAARQALVEYQYRQALDFQGMGETLIRTGEGAKVTSAAELLTAALKDQIGGLLSELQPDPAKTRPKADSEGWLKSAIEAAEQDGARGLRVTRVVPDLTGGRASVETRFVARISAGRWETVWQHTETVDTARADKARVERIAADPQVKQVLELFRAAGLGEGETQLQSALRYGAATMQAQETADAWFVEFRERYLQRLEGPPLLVGADP